jgi:hypothetical protein
VLGKRARTTRRRRRRVVVEEVVDVAVVGVLGGDVLGGGLSGLSGGGEPCFGGAAGSNVMGVVCGVLIEGCAIGGLCGVGLEIDTGISECWGRRCQKPVAICSVDLQAEALNCTVARREHV